MGSRPIRIGLVGAMAATVLAANWTLERYGFISIGFGLTAPAGLFWAGLTLGLRDALSEVAGRWWVIGAIGLGAVLSSLVHPDFAVASAAAFGLSELADLSIYEPLRARDWRAAVVASNLIGAVADSLIFLWLAFETIDGWEGLTVGKAYVIPPSLLIVGLVRRFALLR